MYIYTCYIYILRVLYRKIRNYNNRISHNYYKENKKESYIVFIFNYFFYKINTVLKEYSYKPIFMNHALENGLYPI